MRRVSNECVDCTALGLPCLCGSCPNRHVLRLYCDRCHKETSELFKIDEDEICEDCLLEQAEFVQCENCGDATELVYYNGKMLCNCCFMDATRITD